MKITIGKIVIEPKITKEMLRSYAFHVPVYVFGAAQTYATATGTSIENLSIKQWSHVAWIVFLPALPQLRRWFAKNAPDFVPLVDQIGAKAPADTKPQV